MDTGQWRSGPPGSESPFMAADSHAARLRPTAQDSIRLEGSSGALEGLAGWRKLVVAQPIPELPLSKLSRLFHKRRQPQRRRSLHIGIETTNTEFSDLVHKVDRSAAKMLLGSINKAF